MFPSNHFLIQNENSTVTQTISQELTEIMENIS